MWKWKCGSAVEQCQGMCVTYCEWFVGNVKRKARNAWIVQEMVSETGDRETEERPQWRKEGKKERLQQTEERIEKNHREDQERIPWQYTWRDCGISTNTTLWFSLHEETETSLEIKPLDSKFCHWILSTVVV